MKYTYASIVFKPLTGEAAAAVGRAAGTTPVGNIQYVALLTVDGGQSFVSSLSDSESLEAGAQTLVVHDAIYEPVSFNRRLLHCPVALSAFGGAAVLSADRLDEVSLAHVLSVFGAHGWRAAWLGGRILMERARE